MIRPEEDIVDVVAIKQDLDRLDDGLRTLAHSTASIIKEIGALSVTVKGHSDALKAVEKLVDIGNSLVLMFRVALLVGSVNVLTKVVAAWIAAATHGVVPGVSH